MFLAFDGDTIFRSWKNTEKLEGKIRESRCSDYRSAKLS